MTFDNINIFFMISVKMGILKNEVIMNLATRVREEATGPPSLKANEISSVAALAHHIQFNIDYIILAHVDLSTVPTQHLVSLVSSVTRTLLIEDVNGCDLVTLLDSVKCGGLSINRQSLGREETQALVRALESHVEKMRLYDVELDIEALLEYSGQGRCRFLDYGTYEITAEKKNLEKLKTWKKEKEWRFVGGLGLDGLACNTFSRP